MLRIKVAATGIVGVVSRLYSRLLLSGRRQGVHAQPQRAEGDAAASSAMVRLRVVSVSTRALFENRDHETTTALTGGGVVGVEAAAPRLAVLSGPQFVRSEQIHVLCRTTTSQI